MWFQGNNFYQHVSLLCPLGANSLLIDPMQDRVEILAFAEGIDVTVSNLKKEGILVIRYKQHIDESKVRSIYNIVPSCVSLVKVLSGIKAPVVTPLGLARHLLKSGGEFV